MTRLLFNLVLIGLRARRILCWFGVHAWRRWDRDGLEAHRTKNADFEFCTSCAKSRDRHAA